VPERTPSSERNGTMNKRQLAVLITFLFLAVLASLILDSIQKNTSRQVEAVRQKTIAELVQGLNDLKQDIGRNPSQKEGLLLLFSRRDRRTAPGWRGPYIDADIVRIEKDVYRVNFSAGLLFTYHAGTDADYDVPFAADKGKNNKWDVEVENGLPLYNDPYLERRNDDILLREIDGVWIIEE